MSAFEHLSPESRLLCGSDSLGRFREIQRAGGRRTFVIASPSVAAQGEVEVFALLEAAW